MKGRECDSDGEFAARVFEGNEDVSAKISDALRGHVDLSRFSVFVSPCRGVVTVQWEISDVFESLRNVSEIKLNVRAFISTTPNYKQF